MSDEPRAEDPADLAFSTSNFQALLERAFDGIFVRRGDELVYVNPALLALLGYDRADELLGHSVLKFIHPDHHRALTERIQSTDHGQGSEPPITVRCVRRDGKSVWLDGAGMPAKYQGDWAYLVLVRDVTAQREEGLALRVMRETLGARLDVTEQELEQARVSVRAQAEMRQLAEEQLRQAQKMDAVGRLAGGIAHDFNNLLSVILSHSSVLARSLEPDDPLRASAREVLAAGQRAADLTRQLLAVSRRQRLEPRLIDVNGVVKNMSSMLGRIVGEQIELECHLAADAPAARMDPTQLEQVILNLVANSRDAMPGGGRIDIETSREVVDSSSGPLGLAAGLYVLLTVRDTGVGMDEQTVGRIFEPFFTTKDAGTGVGLGLSIAHGITLQSGGAIRVDSAPGAGARFSVYLPAGAERARSAPAGSIEAARAGTETIMVAEDDPAVRRVIREVLSSAGYRVLAAATGAELLRMAQRHDGLVHLLLTDFAMPGMTGLELAQTLTLTQRRLRVLIVSGYLKHDQLPASMHFLPKPFTDDDLLAKVRDVLDGSYRASGGRCPDPLEAQGPRATPK